MIILRSGRGNSVYDRKPLPISRDHRLRPNPWDKALPDAQLIWGEGAAIFFLVDCLRRKYRGDRAAALAFALLGLISGGIGSLVYYAFWGYRPLKPAEDVFGGTFCTECLASTRDQAAPGSHTFRFVLGNRYMGTSDPCIRCRSVIRTLWLWILLPIIPFGSYRVISTDTHHFIGRRASLRWSQVLSVYIMTLAVAACVAIIYRVGS
jgi:hypothetical protein